MKNPGKEQDNITSEERYRRQRRRLLGGGIAAFFLVAATPAYALSSWRKRLLKKILKAVTTFFTGGFPIAWEMGMQMMTDMIKQSKKEENDRMNMSMGAMGDHIGKTMVAEHNQRISNAAMSAEPVCADTTYPAIVGAASQRVAKAAVDNGQQAASASLDSRRQSRSKVVAETILNAVEDGGDESLSAANFVKGSGYTDEEAKAAAAFLASTTASLSAWTSDDDALQEAAGDKALESQRAFIASASNMAIAVLDDIRNRRVRLPTRQVAEMFGEEAPDLAEVWKQQNPDGTSSFIDLLNFEAARHYHPAGNNRRRLIVSDTSLNRSVALTLAFNTYLRFHLHEQRERASLLRAVSNQLNLATSAGDLQRSWQASDSKVNPQ
ncbi:hypothetical protein [Alcanivorax sp. 1008]|uniref:hypothetical protein n=1 Tax=Alcanivorax sp. 1008 TaxID=2816853 RepID=UPI001DDACBF7|nr:hypothetical protein [Alcanivorax sp. 1008]MCC1496740.1 hypothetical protein [Alcanivorax sp. 1008]